MNNRCCWNLFLCLCCIWFGQCPEATFASECSHALIQDEFTEATKAAIDVASKSVVQIDTVGGLTPKGQTRSTAPFTGTAVTKNGLIVTASYNLLHEPASIFVKLPGTGKDAERFVAEIIATDRSRNLTLLKIERQDLIPIRFANLNSVEVGQRAIAVGKSISIQDANVSFGIVSAKGRIWNRATQTDAKISRQNYGGPLVDLAGEAIGILVPMQHSSSEIAAGSQWYDSGIGFAANLDPNSDSFKRLVGGESIRAGLIGVTFEGQDQNADSAKISFCLPTSPAGKAGLKVGDTIVEAAGQKVIRQGQFKHIIGPLYEEEILAIKVDRDGETLDFEIELAGEIDPYIEPELGVLLRPEMPIVGAIIPRSPASESGLVVGDQITSVNDVEVANTDDARQAISQLVVGEPCRLVVAREGRPVELTIKPRRQLADLLEKVPSRYETGRQQRTFETVEISVAEGSNKCVAFVPKMSDEDKDRPKPAVLVWVPPPGPVDQKAMFKKFENFCVGSDSIVLVPESVDSEKWLPDDSSVIAKSLEKLQQRSPYDANRVAIAGKGSGGEMAMLTAFSNRKTFKGVAVIDAELSTSVPNMQSLPSTRLHMLVFGDDTNDESIEFFRDNGFSVFGTSVAGDAVGQLFGWLVTLDRL